MRVQPNPELTGFRLPQACVAALGMARQTSFGEVSESYKADDFVQRGVAVGGVSVSLNRLCQAACER